MANVSVYNMEGKEVGYFGAERCSVRRRGK